MVQFCANSKIERVFFGLEILVLTDMIKIYIDIRYK